MRNIRSWDPIHKPTLIPVSGWHDEMSQITFIPWSDVQLSCFGWQLVPHRGGTIALVYLHLSDKEGVVEIRCKRTEGAMPDPENDQLLGTVTIPT